MKLSGTAARISGAGDSSATEATTYSATAELSYPLTPWLGALAAYRFSRSDDAGVITSHVVTVGLVFTYPLHLR